MDIIIILYFIIGIFFASVTRIHRVDGKPLSLYGIFIIKMFIFLLWPLLFAILK